MNSSPKWWSSLLAVFACLLLFPSGAGGESEPGETLRVHLNDRAVLTVESDGAALEELVGRIFDIASVEIRGLERLYGEAVRFSGAGPVEQVVKEVLKAVGATSYALEFAGESLVRVNVLPASEADAVKPQDAEETPRPEDGELSAVRVVGLTEESQARQLGVREGDIVLVYNGVRVENTQQLIAAVRRTSPEQSVEMLLLRDRLPLRIYLNGGFIGIRIRSEKVDGRGLDKFLP